LGLLQIIINSRLVALNNLIIFFIGFYTDTIKDYLSTIQFAIKSEIQLNNKHTGKSS